MRYGWSYLRGVWFSAAVLLVAGWAAQARAGQVVPMTLSEISDLAGQAMVGEVTSVRSYWAEDPKRIESEITFERVQYLKGALAESKDRFTLIVPGGAVDGWQLRVSCTPTFAAGERWILFLLPTYKTFPVVGLHQGALRVERDADGVDRVYDVSRRPVTGLDARGFIQAAGVGSADESASADGSENGAPPTSNAQPTVVKDNTSAAQENLVAADGVRIRFVGPPSPPDPAMSYDDFVAMIRPVLERSKAHALSVPAGRPELRPYVAVPMQRSPSAAQASEQGVAGVKPAQPTVRGSAAPPHKVDAQPRNPSSSAKEVRP